MEETDVSSDDIGLAEPIHRTNSKHPLTGQLDVCRRNVGDRRRIEQLEFREGRLICGVRSEVTGEYCLREPEPGQMRCLIHQKSFTVHAVTTPSYSMTSHVFQRCSTCRLNECGYKSDQLGGNECVIERDLYETLNDEVVKFVTYGEVTKQLFEQLVWTRVLLYRAYAQLATEGLTVTEVTGFAQMNGNLQAITNEREHPVLKHIAKLQQVDKQLCDALELTPSAKTKKGEAETNEKAQTNLTDLIKKAFVRFGESGSKPDLLQVGE